MAAASSSISPALKRSETIADSMPDALRESRYHMKRCFAKYTEKGKRLMKLHHLMEEMEIVIDDKAERQQVLSRLARLHFVHDSGNLSLRSWLKCCNSTALCVKRFIV